MTDLRIYKRNSNLEIIDEITVYKNLEFIKAFNAPGKWKMTGFGSVPFSKNQWLVIEQDDESLFYGIVKAISKDTVNQNGKMLSTWEITGLDSLAILSHRHALPDPVTLNFSTSEYDTRTGSAGSVIVQYVDYNCGSNAVASRQFGKFQVEASSLGATITGKARFQNLLSFISDLAILGGGLGFKVVYDKILDKLVFKVYQPADRSNSVKFSVDFGNVQEFSYREEAPEGNYIVALGQGEGIARYYSIQQDADSITDWGLIEYIKDQRNEPDSTKLSSWALAELEKRKAVQGFSVVPTDVSGVSFAFGTDYDLGDIVTMTDDEITLQANISEVITTISENGVIKTKPVLGDIKTIPLAKTFSRIKDIENRINLLENSV